MHEPKASALSARDHHLIVRAATVCTLFHFALLIVIDMLPTSPSGTCCLHQYFSVSLSLAVLWCVLICTHVHGLQHM